MLAFRRRDDRVGLSGPEPHQSRVSPTPTVSQSRQGARVDQVGGCGANA